MRDEFDTDTEELELGSELDALIAEELEAEAHANAPGEEEREAAEAAARAMAEKLNLGFLFGVDRFVCPSANLYEIVNLEDGTQALTPLCTALGGDAPAWLSEALEKYQPYIGAGIYMGMTIFKAKQLEAQAQQQAEAETETETPTEPGAH